MFHRAIPTQTYTHIYVFDSLLSICLLLLQSKTFDREHNISIPYYQAHCTFMRASKTEIANKMIQAKTKRMARIQTLRLNRKWIWANVWYEIPCVYVCTKFHRDLISIFIVDIAECRKWNHAFVQSMEDFYFRVRTNTGKADERERETEACEGKIQKTIRHSINIE